MILICTPMPPPTGGITTWNSELVKSGVFTEKELYFFKTNSERKESGIYSSGRRIFDGIKHLRKKISSFYKLVNSKENGVDLVHINSSGGLAHFRDLMLIIISKLSGKPVVLHCHFNFYNAWNNNIFNSSVFKVACLLSNKVLIFDEPSKHHLNEQKYISIFNGFGKIKFVPTNYPEKENIFFYAGWIIPQKGVFDLVAAWSKLGEQAKHFKLILAGSSQNNYKQLITQQISNQNNIEYVGQLNREQMNALLGRAKFFVLPSYSEGFPFVLTEALAYGCHLISTDVGGFYSYLNDKSVCSLVEVGNIDNLANQLKQSIVSSESSSSSTFNSLSEYQNYLTNEQMALALKKIWEQLISTK